jgi:hypothetical protein
VGSTRRHIHCSRGRAVARPLRRGARCDGAAHQRACGAAPGAQQRDARGAARRARRTEAHTRTNGARRAPRRERHDARRELPFGRVARPSRSSSAASHRSDQPRASRWWRATVRDGSPCRTWRTSPAPCSASRSRARSWWRRRDAVHGFVASAGDVYRFGPDAAGSHRTYALADVDPGAYPPPGAFCVNDAHPELALATPPVAGTPAPPVAATGLRVAQVAIETDREFRQKFATDQAALEYLGELLAAASAIYERDVSVRLTFSYIRLWGASPADPWSATDPSAALDELRAYWLDPAKNMATIAGQRDLVHFLSGKAVHGGVAYVDVLCSQAYGFGVSQVQGAFDLASPSNIWDVMVLTHELGHNFGSPHTHCYSPPLDRCYNAEPGCYSGPVVSSRGTIMSYCHLTGGLSNIDLVLRRHW